MKAICCVLGFLFNPVALGQSETASGDPAWMEDRAVCLKQCEQVFTDCKSQCQDTSADAHERHFDTPDLPVGQCIRNCEEYLRLCKQDC